MNSVFKPDNRIAFRSGLVIGALTVATAILWEIGLELAGHVLIFVIFVIYINATFGLGNWKIYTLEFLSRKYRDEDETPVTFIKRFWACAGGMTITFLALGFLAMAFGILE